MRPARGWAALQASRRPRRPRAAAEAEALLVALRARLAGDRARRSPRATASSILLYVDSIATALSHHNIYKDKLNRYLSQVNGGEPENILILGSDKRANLQEDPGRSDTTILLRLDPDRNAIAVMSIPRDLKVEIPGFGTEKFNAAYTYGGPN